MHMPEKCTLSVRRLNVSVLRVAINLFIKTASVAAVRCVPDFTVPL